MLRGEHLVCYRIDPQAGSLFFFLSDQFESRRRVRMDDSLYLCEPADKTPIEGWG